MTASLPANRLTDPGSLASCPSCHNIIEPVLRVFRFGGQQGPLLSACPDCGSRLLPLTGEIERTKGLRVPTGMPREPRDVSETNGAAHGPSSPSLSSKVGADSNGARASAPTLPSKRVRA